MRESKIIPIGVKIGDWIKKEDYYLVIDKIELIGHLGIKVSGVRKEIADYNINERAKRIDELLSDKNLYEYGSED